MSGIRTSPFLLVPTDGGAVFRGAGIDVGDAATLAAATDAGAAVPGRAGSVRLPNRESISESEYPICSPSSATM